MTEPPPLTLGTAGHIDHGKTALIRSLTGIDTDRLPQERARGISIELGYAPLRLPSGRTLSVVDVPGHERFVRTMVAGATGIDLYLMTVAADDGVMPQTREHAAVLRALGVAAGVVAVTKSDLADPDVAMLEATELLPAAEAVAVSARTGAGLDELRGALDRVAASLPGRAAAAGPARLHVDRVFTIRGAGTVVTGTLWSGSVGRGDSLVVLPSRFEVRVRAVQVHDAPLERAAAGQRVAVNLTGVAVSEVSRGDVLASPDALDPPDGALRPAYRLEAELEFGFNFAEAGTGGPRAGEAGTGGPGAGEAGTGGPRAGEAGTGGPGAGGPGADPHHGHRVQVHHGTRESPARLRHLGGNRWQLRLERPLIAAPGDRLVIRQIAPPDTIGGGVVVAAAGGDRPHSPARELRASGRPPAAKPALTASAVELERRLQQAGLEPPLDSELDADDLAALRDHGRAIRVARNLHYHPDALRQARDRVVAIAERNRGAVTLSQLRDELGTSRKFAQALLEHFDAEKLTIRRGDAHYVRQRQA